MSPVVTDVLPELTDYRREFPIFERASYLNTCSLGALSRRSMEAVGEFFERWNERGASAWYDVWMAELDGLRQRVARLIGAGPHEIAIMPNVSAALAGVASALDYDERSKVVISELDFPTDAYQWMNRRRLGARLEIVESPDRITVPLEAYRRAIDRETTLVITSRVFFTSGAIQDIQAIAEIAHEQGAYCFIDDYQGTGQLPLDVKAAGVDFLVTGGLKWLLGGPGSAFLYVDESLIERLEPAITGWFGNAEQLAFDLRRFSYRPDAARFETGTPSLSALYSARGGLELVEEIGVEKIRARTDALTTHLIEGARQRGLQPRVAKAEADRTGIVMIPMERPDEVVGMLAKQGIIVDYRPGALRISPYFYNTLDENDRILDAIVEILGRRG